ncbi:MAG: cytochrome c peroxidase [Planctomycetota bacterium]|nr:cytochrome c peroxidase [Planctomycetota bacterium]MEC9048162.1 cytochrome c peroxidase [Planctomycetota bacterium]
MKIGSLLAGCLPALLLVACGGDSKPNATEKASTAAPKAASKPAPKAADTAQDPKPKRRRQRRPRVNTQLVKTLFGNDPASPKAPVASTPELVALGNALYHSEHLSAQGTLSCASCHDLNNYGVDSKPTSTGERNTPTTLNASRHFRQFWDGRAASVEELVVMPTTSPDGHGLADAAATVAKIKEQADLVAAFQAAFPGEADPVTAEHVGVAVGAFERTLVTKSKWDDYLDGDSKALSNEELLGLKTFMDVGCTQCHMTRLLGGHTYQKLGVLKPYTGKDTGRMKVTGQESDKYMFKVPSLVNVEKTAPYYHDGSMATLREAVVDMADNQLNKQLKDEQIDAIVTFLKATTGALPEGLTKK